MLRHCLTLLCLLSVGAHAAEEQAHGVAFEQWV